MAVVVGGTLPAAAARHAVDYELASANAVLGLDTSAGPCQRMSARRVDCKGRVEADCGHIGAVILRAGFAVVRHYRCSGGFQRRPRWRGRASA
jgi:hypothetical protein